MSVPIYVSVSMALSILHFIFHVPVNSCSYSCSCSPLSLSHCLLSSLSVAFILRCQPSVLSPLSVFRLFPICFSISIFDPLFRPSVSFPLSLSLSSFPCVSPAYRILSLSLSSASLILFFNWSIWAEKARNFIQNTEFCVILGRTESPWTTEKSLPLTSQFVVCHSLSLERHGAFLSGIF
jgi:hypothetical protein